MLGLAPLPRTLAAALRDARHEKPAVRASAMADLVRLSRGGESEAAGELLRLLEQEPVDQLRAKAALCLADAEVRSARDALLASFENDRAPGVRQFAILALGELGEPGDAGVVAVLEGALREAEAPIRFQALLSLHQLRAERAPEAIAEAMTDPDPEIRRMSFRLAEAEFADRGLPELARARARAALDGAHPAVKPAAALALAQCGDTSGEGILIELIHGRPRGVSFEDQQAAIALAGELGLQTATAALERRAFGGFLLRDLLAHDACVALARLGNARARAALIRDLGGLGFRRRTRAAEAVGRARLHEARPALEALASSPSRADPEIVKHALELLDGDAAAGGA